MKALSIRQPWAWAILHAGKDIENRTWRVGYFGPFLVHASKKYDKQGHKWIEEQMGIEVQAELPVGGIVGQVELTGYVKNSTSPWYLPEHWGFALKTPRPIELLPWNGRLGFFDFPDELLGRLIYEQG